MPLQEFDLGGGGSSSSVNTAISTLPAFWAAQSRSAEVIGQNIRESMLQNQVQSQSKELGTALQTVKPGDPNALQQLAQIAMRYPLASQTPAGQMAIQTLGSQAQAMQPLVMGMPGGAGSPPSGGGGGYPAPGGQPGAGAPPSNAQPPAALDMGQQGAGQPGTAAASPAPDVNSAQANTQPTVQIMGGHGMTATAPAQPQAYKSGYGAPAPEASQPPALAQPQPGGLDVLASQYQKAQGTADWWTRYAASIPQVSGNAARIKSAQEQADKFQTQANSLAEYAASIKEQSMREDRRDTRYDKGLAERDKALADKESDLQKARDERDRTISQTDKKIKDAEAKTAAQSVRLEIKNQISELQKVVLPVQGSIQAKRDFLAKSDPPLKGPALKSIQDEIKRQEDSIQAPSDRLDTLNTKLDKLMDAGVGEPLDAATAAKLLQQAGGDKDKARDLAKQAGYSF
ncbi:MAG TPA: hypothetical protein VMQ76_12640 [Terracidiphilus sp.]|nr:hypothetical protein [Terracidiphilus sp.]